ncbi:MAG TPA: hypothetical protein VIW29_10520 [Polyangiaceae bacterium]
MLDGSFVRRLVLAGAVLALTTGCAMGVGAAAGGALLVAGILSYECYDYVTITVIDEATGDKTCAAKVTVTEDGSEQELGSCYYAPLTEGHWTVRAALPGRPAVTTSVDVTDSKGCQPSVSTILLTIPAPGATSGPRRLVPAGPASPAPPASPATAPAPAAPPAPTPEVPSAPSPAPPAPTLTPEAPATQSFPD